MGGECGGSVGEYGDLNRGWDRDVFVPFVYEFLKGIAENFEMCYDRCWRDFFK